MNIVVNTDEGYVEVSGRAEELEAFSRCLHHAAVIGRSKAHLLSLERGITPVRCWATDIQERHD